MRNNYWIAMDINGTLFVYCDDCKFHRWSDIVINSQPVMRQFTQAAGLREPHPWKFDGSECVTADCLPGWSIDNYMTEKLPQSLQESFRS